MVKALNISLVGTRFFAHIASSSIKSCMLHRIMLIISYIINNI